MSDLRPAARPAQRAPADAPRCVDGHCVTCSDEGVPMRVVSVLDPGMAVCEGENGRRTDVLTALVEEPREGDTLLVHAGTALLRLDPHATEAP